MMGLAVLLVIASAGAVFVAWLAQSPELLMVAGPAAIASLWVWLKAWLARLSPPETEPEPEAEALRLIVVDGSNVMHWKDNTAQLSTLIEVLRALEARGYSPGVVFDANAGYKIAGSYRHDFAFGRLLGLPQDRVMVVHKGAPADPVILAAAAEHGVRVVSNERFRDWAAQFPQVSDSAHFLRGGYDKNGLWLQPETEPALSP